MSDYGFYLERARKASAMLSAVEAAAERRPKDRGMRINVISARRVAARAEQELDSVAAREQVDVCRYRLVAGNNDGFSVSGVTKSLEGFQEVFTFVYDALVDYPKQIARLSRRRYDETSLEFGYSFAGSLGVVLVAPGYLKLFGEGKFDDTLDAINSIFDISDEDELRDTAKRLGKAAVQKVYQWSLANYSAGFAVDLKWTTPSTIHKGRYLDWEQFERISSLIGMTSDVETVRVSPVGTLVGFNSRLKTFHFVVPDGESYKGTLDDSFPVSHEWTVNHRYAAEITVSRTVKLATGEEIVRERLDRLREIA